MRLMMRGFVARVVLVETSLFLSLAVLQSSVYAVPVTVTMAGTVTNADNNNMGEAGLKVKGYLNRGTVGNADVTGATTKLFPQTDNNGAYSSPPSLTANSGAAATVQWNIFYKQQTNSAIAQGTGTQGVFANSYTYLVGSNFGAVTLAAAAGNVAAANLSVKSKTVKTTYTFNRAGMAITLEALGSVDPTYTFTPTNPANHQGTIAFSDTIDPGVLEFLYEGTNLYTDDTMATDNSSLETIFDQPVTMSPIQVLGMNPDGSFQFGTGHIQIGDASSGVYLAGDIVNVSAFTAIDGPVFNADLIVTQLGGSGLNSRLIDEFRALQSQGAAFCDWF